MFLRRLATALLLVAGALPAQQSSDTAMGLFPFLVGNMDGRVTEVVNACASRGIDTIYCSVFRTTGALQGDLWITDANGTWNPAFGPVRPGGAGIDLRSLINVAHASNLRVVGVLKCFADNVQPTDAAHRQYLLDVIGWFVDQFAADGRPLYDLDGIALDYVRFVGAASGNSPTFVTDFVRDVKARIGVLSLHAYLLANRYTFDGPNYDLNFASYSSVIASLSSQFGQHWEQMARHVDVMMPMTYSADGSIYQGFNEHEAYVRTAASYCRTACTNAGFPTRRVCPVVKTYSGEGETTTTTTIDASIVGALNGGASGWQAFRYATMQTSWWPILAAHATPGANFPRPGAAIAVNRLSGTLDTTSSIDADQSAASLQVRVDWNDDGILDTTWLNSASFARLAPAVGVQRLGLLVRDNDGHLAATRRRWTSAAPFAALPGGFFASQPVHVVLSLDAGPAAAAHGYFVLASISGTSPGVTWAPGFPVPLNLDPFTDALFAAANSPIFQNAFGTLDANGRGVANFVLPAGLLGPLALRTINWCALGTTPQGLPAFVSNATATFILP